MYLIYLCITFFISINIASSTPDTTQSLHNKIIKELIPDNFQEALDSSVLAQLLDFMQSTPKVASALEQLKPFDTASFSLDNLITRVRD
jgi:hypothetical protein